MEDKGLEYISPQKMRKENLRWFTMIRLNKISALNRLQGKIDVLDKEIIELDKKLKELREEDARE